MGSLSIAHWFVILLLMVLWVVPLWRILKKAGYNPGISLVALLPPVGLIVLWWSAFADGRTRVAKGELWALLLNQ